MSNLSDFFTRLYGRSAGHVVIATRSEHGTLDSERWLSVPDELDFLERYVELRKDEDTYYETRCVLRARIAVAGGITVLVSHFGLAQSEKRNAVAKVLELLKEETGPVILMGDFNMEPNDWEH